MNYLEKDWTRQLAENFIKYKTVVIPVPAIFMRDTGIYSLLDTGIA